MNMDNYRSAEEIMGGTSRESEAQAEPKKEDVKAEVTPRVNKKDKLANVQAELKAIREEIKALKVNKEKTAEEKAKLEELEEKSAQLKIEREELKKKIENEKRNAVIRQTKKKLADKKQEAIIKVLEAEGLNTENSIKNLIALKRVCSEFNVKNNKALRKCLELVKANSPQTLNDVQ